MLFTLAALIPDISIGEELETIEQDAEAMELIIKEFCQIKNLCDSKQHGEFVIYRLNKADTAKLLTETESNAVISCAQIFEIRLKIQETETLYLYCYDGKHAKQIIEKIL